MIDWLQQWYSSYCDGDWEHSYGIVLNTVDNPGWSLKIDLTDTELDDISLETVTMENSDSDWLYYWIADNTFRAAGDPSKLEQMILVFKELVEKHSKKT
jgi:hypothetical protein